MKTIMSGILFGLLVGVAGAFAADADDDAAKKEFARFEGTWKFASIEVDGMKVPEKAFVDSRLILKGSNFTVKEAGGTFKGTYKVDVTKTPKQIDVTFTDGEEKGKTMLGIYELDGDTYKACMAAPGKGKRPTAFESKPESGHILEILKRVKE
jgi:uncharacterized protein (TIGR03067 family)